MRIEDFMEQADKDLLEVSGDKLRKRMQQKDEEIFLVCSSSWFSVYRIYVKARFHLKADNIPNARHGQT